MTYKKIPTLWSRIDNVAWFQIEKQTESTVREQVFCNIFDDIVREVKMQYYSHIVNALVDCRILEYTSKE